MDEDSDRDVWARVLAGEARTFGVIWDRHRDRIFGHLLVLGAPRGDAEDLTAVVFLELWRRRGEVRFVEDSLVPWLIVVAQNVTRNAARSTRRYAALIARVPQAEPATDPADVAQERLGARVRLARQVLQGARGDDRELVVLTAVEGFTVAQAAEAVGLSEPAARMRLSRLRKRLNQASRAAALEEGAS